MIIKLALWFRNLRCHSALSFFRVNYIHQKEVFYFTFGDFYFMPNRKQLLKAQIK
jgi:hypothetical protein